TAGILAQTGEDTFAKRTITGTSNEIVVTNGDGASGNPTLALSDSIGADKAFRRGNILGTVSESSGVPTGAIIERDSNANGDYVRFADGTQICTADVTFNTNRTDDFTEYLYPASFAVQPSGGG